ncbi:MAG: hypothetical protein ACYDA6_11720 [Solirubrobacteraceae bacterium]
MGEPFNQGSAPWPEHSGSRSVPEDGSGDFGRGPRDGAPSEPAGEAASTPIEDGAAEEVDGQVVAIDGPLPWGVRPSTAVARGERTVPAALLPAVAAGSFVAGAVVVSYVNRRRTSPKAAGSRRTLLRHRSASVGVPERIQIVGSRSVLLDVHLLGRGR